MIRGVWVRTLKPGVSYEDFNAAWAPERADGAYPARLRVARNVANERQVITIIELDATAEEFRARAPELARPDALERLAEIVDETDLEGIFEDVCDETSLR